MVADWLATAGSALGNMFTKWYKNRKKSDNNGDDNMGLWSKVKGLFGNNSSSALSSALNTITSAKFQERQYQYNKALLGYQQDWQEKMSNSAHTREVADLRNAGLNPILSATGGSGAVYGSASAPSVGMPDVSPGTDAISAKTAYKNMKLMDSQKENINADTYLKGNQAYTESERYATQVAQTKYFEQQIADLKNQIKNRDAMTAAQIKRFDNMNLNDTMNAISNRTSSSASAYFNTHRALGFSNSWSNNSSGDDKAWTPVFSKSAGWSSGTSYSHSW